MFNVPLNARLPGFRVGLQEDPAGFAMNQDGSARRPLPAVPSAVAFGYDPYGNALQITAPTAVRPAGLFYNADSGLPPTPDRDYVRVAGDAPSEDPLRQAVDRTYVPASGGWDPLRQAVDPAANSHADNGGDLLHQILGALMSNPGATIGSEAGGYLGTVLGSRIPFPGASYFAKPIGMALGGAIGAGTDFTPRAMIDAAPLGANPVAP